MRELTSIDTGGSDVLDLHSGPLMGLGQETSAFLPSPFDSTRLVVRDWSHGSGADAESPSALPDNSESIGLESSCGRGSLAAKAGAIARSPRVMTISPDTGTRCKLLKKFDGIVVSCGDDAFVGRFFEGSDDHPVMEAEIGFEELSDEDRKLVGEGARLVWTIMYREEGGTTRRVSTIYFRKLPPPSADQMRRQQQTAAELMRGVQWE